MAESPREDRSLLTERSAGELSGVTPDERGLRSLLPVRALGPAFVAAVAYVDPGNVATNMLAGSTYGYQLVWVVVAASCLAVLVQYLAAKLGIATGSTLPELCRARFPRAVTLVLWLQAECVAAATDLAEVLGGAIALHILFGLPLAVGGLLVGIVAIAILQLQSIGQVRYERVTAALFLVVVGGFVAAALADGTSVGAVLAGTVPRLNGSGSAVIAAGIVGATVMPHVVYLHAELMRSRFGVATGPAGTARRRAVLRACRADVLLAMSIAGVANLSLLVAAADSLTGWQVADIESATAGLHATIGPVIATLFAVALLVSSIASSSVGTYAGAVIMQGFLRRRIPITLRRLATLLPALVILVLGIEPTHALVLSQVVLSCGIPFALVPLIMFTRRPDLMRELVNTRSTTVAAALGAAAVCGLTLSILF
ncbi:Nramp family divalent metal transporter [Actinoplanes sp. NPDC048967]|uniref:Nramp family divalent metal transporter n=1 Tax=Actinoplanes sp. NPDC048967 TaxID=3155269 RepID=UPI0033EF12E7